MTKFNLIQTYTEDDLILTGFYSEGSKEKEAIIYIHGFCGDFYTHKYISELANMFSRNNFAFVTAQNRGTGMRTEIVSKDRTVGHTIGSLVERLEDAHLDISAYVEFLKNEGYKKFILMGHSLGTIKSVRYLFEGKYRDLISKIILLAPFDKNAYLQNKSGDLWKEHVKEAKLEIEKGNELETIPLNYDDFPMTYRTFYSWYSESDLGQMFDFYRKNYNFPVLNQISIPVQILVGTKDEFFYLPRFNKDAKEVSEILRKNIKNLDITLIEDSGHSFAGFEKDLINNVERFIK